MPLGDIEQAAFSVYFDRLAGNSRASKCLDRTDTPSNGGRDGRKSCAIRSQDCAEALHRRTDKPYCSLELLMAASHGMLVAIFRNPGRTRPRPISGEDALSFRAVFIALVIGTALLVAAYVLNGYRPRIVTEQPTAELVRASGKCAECHANLQYSIVHEYELSVHARKKVNCLECHQPADGQKSHDHHGFIITTHVTAANCRSCHEPVYQQYLRSRHAAPSWAAVYGDKDFAAEQVAFSEQFHPGLVRRAANPLTSLEGVPATRSGCASCHNIGRPNADGTIGACTACHTRHTASVEVARRPTTCGQCHMGPDHAQLEIYEESRHGVLFHAQEKLLNLAAEPKKLTTHDMFVPTCATCHMSGLNGLGVTHDPSERLSYNLFAEVSDKRPNYARAQAAMKDVCRNCHTQPLIDRVYTEAEQVLNSTNQRIGEARALMDRLRKDGVLAGKPFEQPIEFAYFDLWHYYGITAKHGAFMGGADFVQWHGTYPMLKSIVAIRSMAEQMRRAHAKHKD
jgi:hydroxylamine dehydrogenase